jgi:hypothetical protein
MADTWIVFGNYSAHLSDYANSKGTGTYLEIVQLGVNVNPDTSPNK